METITSPKQGTVTTEWTIDLELALANGLRRIKEMEEEANHQKELEQVKCGKAWLDYNQVIRLALPEVLRPMMAYFEDLQSMPDLNTKHETVVIDGGRYGLAPIAVLMRHKPGEPFIVDCYRVFGIIQAFSDHQIIFSDSGDETWLVEPVVYCDLELALAGANRHYLKRYELEKQPRKAEPEYLPADEQLPVDIADRAMIASVRAIVRDEMYKPPQA